MQKVATFMDKNLVFIIFFSKFATNSENPETLDANEIRRNKKDACTRHGACVFAYPK